ncbi:MAG: YjgP/YjgQ family permease [Planctomycetes bacterium]|nr:YjgP/YjgQ family permease [Planctomycetota bacterium]
MSKLDKYIILTFIPALCITAFILMGLYLIVDIFQKLDDLLSLEDRAVYLALNYYSLLLPVMLVRLFPAIVLISVGFVLVKLNKTNELMAMQVSGISMYRILAPLFIAVGILSLLVTVNQEFLVPAFADKLERFKTITFDRSELKELLAKDRTNDILMRVASYDIVEETMYSIFILKNLGDDKYITISAKEGKWIGDDTWYLTDLIINDYADDKWVPPTLEEKEYFLETEIGPEDMREKERETNLTSIFQLWTLAKKDPDNPRYPVYFQSRLSYPFVAPVLVLLGIPFLVGFQRLRKNLFFSIGALIAIVFAFFVVNIFCTNLGVTGNLSPALAGWLPVLIFAVVGLLLLDWAKV